MCLFSPVHRRSASACFLLQRAPPTSGHSQARREYWRWFWPRRRLDLFCFCFNFTIPSHACSRGGLPSVHAEYEECCCLAGVPRWTLPASTLKIPAASLAGAVWSMPCNLLALSDPIGICFVVPSPACLTYSFCPVHFYNLTKIDVDCRGPGLRPCWCGRVCVCALLVFDLFPPFVISFLFFVSVNWVWLSSQSHVF